MVMLLWRCRAQVIPNGTNVSLTNNDMLLQLTNATYKEKWFKHLRVSRRCRCRHTARAQHAQHRPAQTGAASDMGACAQFGCHSNEKFKCLCGMGTMFTAVFTYTGATKPA